MRVQAMPTSGIRSRFRWQAVAAAAVLLAGVGCSLWIGDVFIDGPVVWNALWDYNADLPDHAIVHDWRLPQAIADLLVGASLAVAGAIMQAMTRNPLASPGIMGLNSGSGLAAIMVMVLWPQMAYPQLMLLSVAGAALGATLVYGLASFSRGGLTPVRLALTGVAVSSLLGGVGNGLLVCWDMSQDPLFWAARGTSGVQWSEIATFLPLALLGMTGAVMLARDFGTLTLGDQVACGLGQRTRQTRILGSAIVVLLAGGAVSLAGPVGFIGLMVPHVVRYCIGHDCRRVILGSVTGGAALLLLADLAARCSSTPLKTPVPVGVVTSLLGVPFFLYLACRRPPASRERAA